MDTVITTINSLNQRGGRMLSIVDMIQAKTVTLDQAAWFAEQMARVPSVLSGAVPGGAGKTTLLGALLGLLPKDAGIITVESGRDAKRLLKQKPGKHETALVHEISPGHYYSYLWADDIKALFQLMQAGYSIAATIHADTPDQIYDLVGSPPNAVPRQMVQQLDLLVFMTADSGWIGREHRLRGVYVPGPNDHVSLGSPKPLPATVNCLSRLVQRNVCLIEEVREELIYRTA